jgi:hypothetical protein
VQYDGLSPDVSRRNVVLVKSSGALVSKMGISGICPAICSKLLDGNQHVVPSAAQFIIKVDVPKRVQPLPESN